MYEGIPVVRVWVRGTGKLYVQAVRVLRHGFAHGLRLWNGGDSHSGDSDGDGCTYGYGLDDGLAAGMVVLIERNVMILVVIMRSHAGLLIRH